MESRMSLSRSRDTQSMNGLVEQADAGERAGANVHGPSVLALAGIPAGVLSSAALGRRGEYDAKRLRSQRARRIRPRMRRRRKRVRSQSFHRPHRRGNHGTIAERRRAFNRVVTSRVKLGRH